MPPQAEKTSASSKSFASRLPRFLLFSLLLVVLLVIGAECILRFVLGLGNPVLVTPDQAAAYILKPDQNVVRFFSHTHTNAFGMRADPVPATKDPHTARLLFLGDSITYGTSQVDQSKIFTERIHHDLSSQLGGIPIQVLNASAGAWGISNELGYIQSRGLFHSDLLILVLNSGDLSQPRSTIASVGEGLAVAKPDFALQELWTRYLKRRLFHVAAHIDAGDSTVANADAITRDNLASLDLLKQYADDQHADLVIVYIPFRVELGETSQRSLAILKSWTDPRSVPVIDLSQTESNYSPKQITLEGVHFNAKGHEIAAQQIEKSLVELHASHKILQQF